MRLLRRLEQKLGRFAVPHVTIVIVAVQVMVYALSVSQPNPKQEFELLERLLLIPARVLDGEVWRLLTFFAVPPVWGKSLLGPIWAFFAWYVFYLLGTALEHYWGTLRYNLYLLVGYVATVAVSFAAPESAVTNLMYFSSVFLAFAFLFPEFTFLIFFILPVKARWLALFTWISYGLMFVAGGLMTRLTIVAAIANFLLFFWRDILERLRTGRRRMSQQVAHIARTKEPPYRHRCTVCGITEKTHPHEDFRYCSKCDGQHAYCSKHLREHEHVREEQEAS